MDSKSAGSMPWVPAPSAHFTGEVWFGEMSASDDPDGLDVLGVQFDPGARTDWHSHPGGQVLYVVSGRGAVSNRDGERIEMAAGDTVTTPADELHWHGAAPDSPMMHLSITHGGATVWSDDRVSDADYRA
jgi:quercetin dioxygenase-like cupin family protein